jgi:hypothetical protein
VLKKNMFKTGTTDEVGNYRSMTPSSAMLKILEKIASKQLI